MKNFLCLVLLNTPMLLLAQLSDDFNDSSLFNYPVWLGDVDSFELINQRLHLNAPSNSSESYLSTGWDGAVNGEWVFDVFMDFNPSASNKALIYLMSNDANLKGPLQGYFVMVGNGNDEVSLYKQDGTNTTMLIDGQDGLLSTGQVNVRIKVTRDNLGYFELYTDTSLSGNWHLEGAFFDNQFMQGQYFGLLCDYTTTRSDQFWFDNIFVNTIPYVDNQAPQLWSFNVADRYHMELEFNEVLDSTYASSSFLLNNIWLPYEVGYDNNRLMLGFSSPFLLDTTNTLFLSVQDEANNTSDTLLSFTLHPVVSLGGLRINEIYPDESPSFGMPDAEFIELRNTSLDSIQLNTLFLADQSDTLALPYCVIAPGDLLVLCKTGAVNNFNMFGACLGVPNFPSLNNTGEQLMILDNYKQIVDSVHYSTANYRETYDDYGNLKSSGGYSLERTNQTSPCGGRYNWFPSESSLGATPGNWNTVDSVNYFSINQAVEEVIIENDTTLHIYFEEHLLDLDENNVTIFDAEVEQAFRHDKYSAYILLNEPLGPNREYVLRVEQLIDCYGNQVPSFESSFFYFTDMQLGDIVINEVLFNPHTGGVDFIELYNSSDKLLSLEDFVFQEFDVWYPQEVLEQDPIEKQLIQPNSYHVFTTDSANILLNYTVNEPDWLHEQAIPNLPDDEGIIVLRSPDGIAVDSVYYRSSWHLTALDIQDGFSLERIHARLSSLDKENWHSAAQTYGGATPTAKNSQSYDGLLDGHFSIQPEIFSPDNNAYEDYCLIIYEPEELGQFVELNVYDYQGRLVRNLAQNQHAGKYNTWRWDGLDMNYELSPIGIYVVVLESFDEGGRKRKHRERVVLALPFE